jgi:hypothetical protein
MHVKTSFCDGLIQTLLCALVVVLFFYIGRDRSVVDLFKCITLMFTFLLSERLRWNNISKDKQKVKFLRFIYIQSTPVVVHNVIRGTVPLTYLEKSELNKYKKTLLILGRKKSTKREKLLVLQRTPNVLVIVLNKAISLL